MAAEVSIGTARERTVSLIETLRQWIRTGEGSRVSLHESGAELQDISDIVADTTTRIQFPSFEDDGETLSSEAMRTVTDRRRDLIVLATSLAPSNIEILDWLGERDDKEAAYLYAYSRGSVSEQLTHVGSDFYRRLNSIIDSDPLLLEARRIEVLLKEARGIFEMCQAKAYENMG